MKRTAHNGNIVGSSPTKLNREKLIVLQSFNSISGLRRRFALLNRLLGSASRSAKHILGYIAQLAEHWAFNLMVAGSNPAIPNKTKSGAIVLGTPPSATK